MTAAVVGVPVAPGAAAGGGRCWWPIVLIMAFTLVYTAEHYVVDIVLGWALRRGRDLRPSAGTTDGAPDRHALTR